MNLSLLSKASEIKTDPFPYVVIQNALDCYEELVRTRPSPKQILNGKEPGPNVRVDMTTREAIETLPEPWKSFCRYHTSQAFIDDVFDLFGDHIRSMYPGLKVPSGVRTNGVGCECQPGLNTPSPELTRVRGVHLDNPKELYAGLFYMRSPEDKDEGGDLNICRWNEKTKRFYGKLEVEDECVEVVDTVKYEPNTFVFFISGPDSLHSVTPRKSRHYRNLVNVMCDTAKPLFKVGHGSY